MRLVVARLHRRYTLSPSLALLPLPPAPGPSGRGQGRDAAKYEEIEKGDGREEARAARKSWRKRNGRWKKRKKGTSTGPRRKEDERWTRRWPGGWGRRGEGKKRTWLRTVRCRTLGPSSRTEPPVSDCIIADWLIAARGVPLSLKDVSILLIPASLGSSVPLVLSPFSSFAPR